MATQIVISNEDYVKIDDSFHIDWINKGNAMPALPDTIHYVIWNDLTGQNEIQHKDASTGNMTGNVDLNATSDAVGSTTIADLLTWGETRKGEIETAIAAYGAAVADDEANGTNNAEGKTWVDYDPNYS
jgi:hypothetical protein|tara:strand:- start:68 stop:454 length:387 start_codon:yes stop_codon:yes gene_type:complete